MGRRRRLTFLLAGLVLSFLIPAAIVFHYGLRVPVPFLPAFDSDAYFAVFNHLHDKTHARFGGLLNRVIAAYLIHFTAAVQLLERQRELAKAAFLLSLLTLAIFLVFTPFKPSLLTALLGPSILVWDRNIFTLAVGYLLVFGFTRMGSESSIMRLLRKGLLVSDRSTLLQCLPAPYRRS